MTEMTMLSMLMPVGSFSFRKVPASQPPTTAPTMPRRIVPINPSRPPTIMLARKPAIAPSTIHARMPILSVLPYGASAARTRWRLSHHRRALAVDLDGIGQSCLHTDESHASLLGPANRVDVELEVRTQITAGKT